MIVVEYEACFYKFVRDTTSIIDAEYDKVCCVVCGLRLPIRMATHSLSTVGRSFAKVLDHARVMMRCIMRPKGQ